ncbi:MAG: hypothetical protein NZM00_05940, partial [Anaerolinea sp.]|nr:hypothetical protein [Anaerolinea sp.]
EGLDDRDRSALQFLLNQGKRGVAPASNFTLVYGDIRKLGASQIARTSPLKTPANVSESLYYRGLISFAFENSEQGARRIVFIPEELIPLLADLAGYRVVYQDDEIDEESDDEDEVDAAVAGEADEDDEDDEDDQDKYRPAVARTAAPMPAQAGARRTAPPAAARPPAGQVAAFTAVRPETVYSADTSLVDDLTTILAAISRYEHDPEINLLALITTEAFAANLLVSVQERLMFLLSIALGMNLIRYQDGRLEINRADPARTVSRWLSAPRPEQVRLLAEAWRTTDLYVDLARVPGLRVDAQAGTTEFYPAAARKNALAVMAADLPDDGWWLVEDFVRLMYTRQRDFQRPNGDYQTWYIFDAATGEPLSGVANWDRVDGALLRFYVQMPMHWLGLVDLAVDAQGRPAARLNAYGRAFIKGGVFPRPPDTPEKLVVEADGRISAGRRVSRADRYQVARFTTWGGIVNGAYSYQLDADGIAIAQKQGIAIEQIESFLRSAVGALPEPVAAFLETWRLGAAATVTLERVTVLRTVSDQVLDALWEDPAIRRYFGARLGPTAVVVRAGQVARLRDALGKRGIQIEFIGDVE